MNNFLPAQTKGPLQPGWSGNQRREFEFVSDFGQQKRQPFYQNRPESQAYLNETRFLVTKLPFGLVQAHKVEYSFVEHTTKEQRKTRQALSSFRFDAA